MLRTGSHSCENRIISIYQSHVLGIDWNIYSHPVERRLADFSVNTTYFSSNSH